VTCVLGSCGRERGPGASFQLTHFNSGSARRGGREQGLVCRFRGSPQRTEEDIMLN
jgi:hypothetical protein